MCCCLCDGNVAVRSSVNLFGIGLGYHSLHHSWRRRSRKFKEIPSRMDLTFIGKTNFPFNWVMSIRLLPFVFYITPAFRFIFVASSRKIFSIVVNLTKKFSPLVAMCRTFHHIALKMFSTKRITWAVEVITQTKALLSFHIVSKI